jgi:ATP-dependent RNA helicase DeaD
MLRAIERATRQSIEAMNLPSADAVNARRIARFKQRVTEALAQNGSEVFRPVLEELERETGVALLDIAAALASMSQGNTPLLLGAKPEAATAATSATGATGAKVEAGDAGDAGASRRPLPGDGLPRCGLSHLGPQQRSPSRRGLRTCPRRDRRPRSRGSPTRGSPTRGRRTQMRHRPTPRPVPRSRPR